MYASWKGEVFSSRNYGGSHPWVAKILGLSGRWGLEREFVRGVRDYTHGKEHHSRGVYIYFTLVPGVYEFYRQISWRREDRFFGRVENGKIVKITKGEVIEWLTKECLE